MEARACKPCALPWPGSSWLTGVSLKGVIPFSGTLTVAAAARGPLEITQPWWPVGLTLVGPTEKGLSGYPSQGTTRGSRSRSPVFP